MGGDEGGGGRAMAQQACRNSQQRAASTFKRHGMCACVHVRTRGRSRILRATPADDAPSRRRAGSSIAPSVIWEHMMAFGEPNCAP